MPPEPLPESASTHTPRSAQKRCLQRLVLGLGVYVNCWYLRHKLCSMLPSKQTNVLCLKPTCLTGSRPTPHHRPALASPSRLASRQKPSRYSPWFSSVPNRAHVSPPSNVCFHIIHHYFRIATCSEFSHWLETTHLVSAQKGHGAPKQSKKTKMKYE